MPATFTVFKIWNSGDILTAADQNASFSQLITNLDPSGLGSAESTIAAMRNTSNPYPGGVESLAPSFLVELQQLRYAVAGLTGGYWYQSAGYMSAGLVAATSIYDNVANYRKLTYTPTAYAPAQYNSNAALNTNAPAFEATLSSNQSISSATPTKVQFATETFDTNNNYDNVANYRFTPTIAGKYLFNISMEIAINGSPNSIYLYKNGSPYRACVFLTMGASSANVVFPILADANGTTDYFEAYIYTTNTGTVGKFETINGTVIASTFSGVRVSI